MAEEKKNKLYDQSETIVLKRSQIHEAPYNPKHHTKEQVKQIRENIQRVGLLGGIIWNKTTGNLIDGHKRIMALDIIHKYKETAETDYEIKVEAIELDEKTEKEQNIFQTTSRSELDIEMMSILIPEIDYELAGLTLPDLNVYLPASPIYDMPEYIPDVKKDFEALEKLTEAEKAIEREERKNDIIEKLQPFKGYKVICDSADPRAIDEIYKRGKINIYPVRKGAGSIIAGIEN